MGIGWSMGWDVAEPNCIQNMGGNSKAGPLCMQWPGCSRKYWMSDSYCGLGFTVTCANAEPADDERAFLAGGGGGRNGIATLDMRDMLDSHWQVCQGVLGALPQRGSGYKLANSL